MFVGGLILSPFFLIVPKDLPTSRCHTLNPSREYDACLVLEGQKMAYTCVNSATAEPTHGAGGGIP